MQEDVRTETVLMQAQPKMNARTLLSLCLTAMMGVAVAAPTAMTNAADDVEPIGFIANINGGDSSNGA